MWTCGPLGILAALIEPCRIVTPRSAMSWNLFHGSNKTGVMMRTGGIDGSQIQAMIAQLKAHATRPSLTPPVIQTEAPAAPKAEFSDALKKSLDAVNASQVQSSELSKKFAMGDDSVSLSDVMISMQKSSINFQASIQVRNKLVSAYHDIMNMQV
jgi:flagellar hook-basal body complex protein FliE